MGISKIGSLFAANVDSLAERAKSSGQQSQTPTSVTNAPQQGGEAVVFSSSFTGSKAAPEQSSDRSDRVAQLKQQVARGDYSVDSEKVAVSVLRDLA